MTFDVVIERVLGATQEVLRGLNGLLPQLSSSAIVITQHRLSEIVSDESVLLFVCRLNGTIVGSITLVVFSIPTGVRALIEDVIVDESVRGKQIGEKLVLHALNAAREKGSLTVDLTSRPQREAANKLYVKVGFQLRDTNVYRYILNK